MTLHINKKYDKIAEHEKIVYELMLLMLMFKMISVGNETISEMDNHGL